MAPTNLLGEPEPTRLPPDPVAELLKGGGEAAGGSLAAVAAESGAEAAGGESGPDLEALAAAHPTSSLAWAALAEEALDEGRAVEAYAFARTGYHRGLDALRRAGWRGSGPVPWEHEPNRGFLRALSALGRAATAIGEQDEAQRVEQFLADASPAAVAALAPPAG